MKARTRVLSIFAIAALVGGGVLSQPWIDGTQVVKASTCADTIFTRQPSGEIAPVFGSSATYTAEVLVESCGNRFGDWVLPIDVQWSLDGQIIADQDASTD